MPASACSCLQLRDQGGRPGEMSSEVEGGPGLGGPYGKGSQAPKGPTNCVCKNSKLTKKKKQQNVSQKGSIFKIPGPTRSFPRDQISGGRVSRFPRFLQNWRAAHRRTTSTGLPACRCRFCATSATTSAEQALAGIAGCWYERMAAERRTMRRSKALDETILKHPLNFPNEVTCQVKVRSKVKIGAFRLRAVDTSKQGCGVGVGAGVGVSRSRLFCSESESESTKFTDSNRLRANSYSWFKEIDMHVI